MKKLQKIVFHAWDVADHFGFLTLAYLVIGVTLLVLSSCSTPTSWVVSTNTYHENRGAGMEEFNPGLALEAPLFRGSFETTSSFGGFGMKFVPSPWRAQAGVFRNSLGDLAPYAGVGYYHNAGWIKPGAFAALSWYETNGIVPLLGPSIEIGTGSIRPRISFIPDMGQRGGSVLLFQFSIRFR